MNQPRKDLIYVDKIEWIIALDEEKNKLVMETRNELRANFDKMVSQLDESDDIPVFDEKKAWAEAVEISLGLPQSAVVKIDHAPETDKEMYFMTRDALMSKYNIGYDDAIVLGEIENYDIARPNEIRKQMAIDGLNGVLKGDGLKKYLDNTKNFQHFSHLNRLTVLCHYPNATMVKTHGAWKALGRYPRKGEKAIPLTRPLIKEHTFTDEQALATFRDNYNSNSCSLDHICDDEYKKYRDEIRKNGTVTFGLLDSFIPIYEFELSQTDGKPIVEDKPTPCDVTVLTGMIDCCPAD